MRKTPANNKTKAIDGRGKSKSADNKAQPPATKQISQEKCNVASVAKKALIPATNSGRRQLHTPLVFTASPLLQPLQLKSTII